MRACCRRQLFNYTPASRRGRGVYCFTSVRPSKIFFVAFFSVTVDGRNLIFVHKRHIGIPYCGQRFWTRQIPTSCLPTQLVFIHIEHICTFFVTFFSAIINGRNLIFGHKLHIGTPYRGKRFWTLQIPTSCLPKSGGIISEHQLTVHLVIFISLRPRCTGYNFMCGFLHQCHDIAEIFLKLVLDICKTAIFYLAF